MKTFVPAEGAGVEGGTVLVDATSPLDLLCDGTKPAADVGCSLVLVLPVVESSP